MNETGTPRTTWVRAHLRTNLVAYLALFVSLGGVSYAAVKLPKNSVKARQIAANAVGASEVRRGAVGTSELRSGAVTAGDLGRGGIGPEHLRVGAVGGPQIAPGAVGAAQLAPRSVGRGQLDPGLAADGSTNDSVVTVSKDTGPRVVGATTLGDSLFTRGWQVDAQAEVRNAAPDTGTGSTSRITFRLRRNGETLDGCTRAQDVADGGVVTHSVFCLMGRTSGRLELVAEASGEPLTVHWATLGAVIIP
jgi:hypothetical protein